VGDAVVGHRGLTSYGTGCDLDDGAACITGHPFSNVTRSSSTCRPGGWAPAVPPPAVPASTSGAGALHAITTRASAALTEEGR
jgi:hypothetical protein